MPAKSCHLQYCAFAYFYGKKRATPLRTSSLKTMAIVPTVLSDWVPGPFVLNTKKCGRRAKFSGDNSVVERDRPEEYNVGCVTYTAKTLPLGQVWQTTILSTISGWSGGLVSG